MIRINKSASPEKLLELREEAFQKGKTVKEAFKSLQNPFKSEVTELLMKDQGHLCAYCMRRIPDLRPTIRDVPRVSIEHIYPQNPKSHDGVEGVLDYANMLAVCSGNQGDSQSKGKSRLTCDAKRGNRIMKVNPLDSSTLETIYYTSTGEIASTDKEINRDIDQTLNLNCRVDAVRLPENRKQVLDAIQESVASMENGEIITYSKQLLSEFEKETDPKTPYVGIIIWWLKQFISKITAD